VVEVAPGDALRTVLYVEDSDLNVLLVERILRQLPDLRLLVAGQAEEALATSTREHCDLVLTDLNLPDEAGPSLIAMLRHHPATAHLPIIVVSGDPSPALTEAAMAAGADAFLTKPYTAPELVDLIERALRGELREATPRIASKQTERGANLVDRLRAQDDQDISRVVARLTATARDDMAELRSALANRDLPRALYLAHRLQGGLALYGADVVAERLQAFSAAIGENRVRAAADLLDAADLALAQYLEELRAPDGSPGSFEA
jgi:CheY-like chemotaxis protein/HPt (histidine-containing phosphotransfer) domain-containing protein